jgi:hypothetical protein
MKKKEDANAQNEEDKKEGYYYVQKEEPYQQGGEQPQEHEQDNQKKEDKDVDAEKQDEFKESEYKGDEEAEAHRKEGKDEKDKKSDKKDKEQEKRGPKLEKPELEPIHYFPRPRVPITRVEYFEYVIPKKTVTPFDYFLEEEAQRRKEQRSHSQSHTYQPRFGFNRIPMALPMFGPRRIMPLKIIEIPPRPPKMRPMPPMDVVMQQVRPHTHTHTYTHTMPRVHHGPMQYHLPPHGPVPHHMPHGTVPRYLPHGPVPHRMPHGPLPYHLPPHGPVPHRLPHGPMPYHLPHGTIPYHLHPHGPVPRHLPHGPLPRYLPHGPVPTRVIRRYVQKKEKTTTDTHPYQRYVYPVPQRRFDNLYADSEPEEMSVRSNYVVKRNQESNTESDYDYGEDSYYTYTVNRPRKISTRSVSVGRNNGRLAFNLGNTQPRSMFIRLDDGGLNRTAQTYGNQVANTQTNTSYTQGVTNNGGKRTVYRYYQIKKTTQK